MRYLSVCSGVGCDTLAFHPMGWECVGNAEIEAFPAAVLAHHWPSVTNFGDLNDNEQWRLPDEPDLIIGGTPCQAFSTAGNRKGMDDPRGKLTITFFEMVERIRPRWFVWENVPAVVSTALPAVLKQITEIRYHCAWRVLDSLSFGVPQRRRRLFIVGHLDDWRCAGAVLFDGKASTDNPKVSNSGRPEDAYGKDKGVGEQILIPLIACPRGASHMVTKSHNYHPALLSSRTIGSVSGLGLLHSHAKDPNAALPPIRYLTCEERERLMGMPTGHTDIPFNVPYKSKINLRYKATGNAMVVQCLEWIGERINFINEATK